MKILLLTDGIYPYVIGGMQKHSYNLARNLAENGVEVHLVHCIYEGKLPKNEGKSIAHFGAKASENLTFRCYQFPKLDALPGHYMRENRKYSQMIYEDYKARWEEFDFIYAKGFTGWELLKQKNNIPRPIGINFHGYEMFQKAPSWKVKLSLFLLRGPVKYNSQNADFVFSYGGKITEIIQRLGIDLRKIIEIPTGINQEWIKGKIEEGSSSTDEPNPVRKFVFVGRYERRKGIEELHSALQQLKETELPPFEVHLIGPIPKEHQLAEKHIHYHGQISDSAAIKKILRSCDVLVCPSHSEGMPNVILEGMASGLTVIATDVGAVSHQVEKNGWLLSSPSVEELKNAIKSALSIPQTELNEMKRVSLHLVRTRFLWEKVAHQTIKKITTAIEQYKSKS